MKNDNGAILGLFIMFLLISSAHLLKEEMSCEGTTHPAPVQHGWVQDGIIITSRVLAQGETVAEDTSLGLVAVKGMEGSPIEPTDGLTVLGHAVTIRDMSQGHWKVIGGVPPGCTGAPLVGPSGVEGIVIYEVEGVAEAIVCDSEGVASFASSL